MSDRDELAGFDAALVDDVAAEHGVPRERLATLLRTHQSNVRDLPGVDNIVYEWRNHFHRDPLLARTEAAYYLALPSHVWDEFADSLDVEGDERAALVAVHDRQARRDAATVGVDPDRLDAGDAVVLVRP